MWPWTRERPAGKYMRQTGKSRDIYRAILPPDVGANLLKSYPRGGVYLFDMGGEETLQKHIYKAEGTIVCFGIGTPSSMSVQAFASAKPGN